MYKNTSKSISIIANGGDYEEIVSYVVLAIALKASAYQVRILTGSEHRAYIEDSNLVHVAISSDDVENQLQSDRSIKQAIASGDRHLLAALTKEKSKEIASQHCSSVLQELNENPPDLLIDGSCYGYFGAYANHNSKVPAASVILRRRALCSPDWPHPSDSYSNPPLTLSMAQLDGAMVSLGYPPLKSAFFDNKYVAATSEVLTATPLLFNGVLDAAGLPQVTSAINDTILKRMAPQEATNECPTCTETKNQTNLWDTMIFMISFIFMYMYDRASGQQSRAPQTKLTGMPNIIETDEECPDRKYSDSY